MGASNKIVILVTGDPVPAIRNVRGDFTQIISEVIADSSTKECVGVDARTTTDLKRATAGAEAVVITGSSAHVQEREPWVLRTEAWLRELVPTGVPVFGICFGHQLLAQALGGDVQPNPRGREMSTVTVRCTAADPLLDAVSPEFAANACHSDSAIRLPEGATVLAASDLDPHQCVRFARRCYGVQFHPEFDGDIMRGYVEARAQAILREGGNPQDLREIARDTPASADVLRMFVRSLLHTA